METWDWRHTRQQHSFAEKTRKYGLLIIKLRKHVLLPGMPPIPGFHLPFLPNLFAPNVLVEVNGDMFDPLAMPNLSLVDPIFEHT